MSNKRTWIYINPPATFGIPPCECGNQNPEWSEFKDLLWCAKCQKDYTPEHWGVFDGPIPVGASQMMGITFERLNLETNQIEYPDFSGDRTIYSPVTHCKEGLKSKIL
jgi:hypothetical protein